jgi:hypothetical protein
MHHDLCMMHMTEKHNLGLLPFVQEKAPDAQRMLAEFVLCRFCGKNYFEGYLTWILFYFITHLF